jgi:hypothetical protein
MFKWVLALVALYLFWDCGTFWICAAIFLFFNDIFDLNFRQNKDNEEVLVYGEKSKSE